jgi:hypothetical protein
MARFPGQPYTVLAERLGGDVAALQLEWMQYEEAEAKGSLRDAAMDSLARDLHAYLPNGWRNGAKEDFDTSSAFAVWATRLEQRSANVKAYANAVWDALEALSPPAGWSPTGPDDPLVKQAFLLGWPNPA